MNPSTRQVMEGAAAYFTKHYQEDLSIEDYAAKMGISTCWFIRSFKQVNGMTPKQYIFKKITGTSPMQYRKRYEGML